MIKEGVFCEKKSGKGLGDVVIRLSAAGGSRLRKGAGCRQSDGGKREQQRQFCFGDDRRRGGNDKFRRHDGDCGSNCRRQLCRYEEADDCKNRPLCRDR